MTERYRLPKSDILRGYRSFGAVLSGRKYVASHGIRCYYTCIASIPPYSCAVGFAVRKTTTAVARNRCRRLLREAWRLRQRPLQQTCEELRLALRCVLLTNANACSRTGDAVANIISELTGILRACDTSSGNPSSSSSASTSC